MKKSFMIVLMAVLLMGVVSAVESETKVNLQEISYKQLLVQENVKTQSYIKKALDDRDTLLENKIKEYIDSNFVVMDERIDQFIRKGAFKLGMVFFSAVVLAGTILLYISHVLKRKRIVRKTMHNEKETITLSGADTIKKEVVEE